MVCWFCERDKDKGREEGRKAHERARVRSPLGPGVPRRAEARGGGWRAGSSAEDRGPDPAEEAGPERALHSHLQSTYTTSLESFLLPMEVTDSF